MTARKIRAIFAVPVCASALIAEACGGTASNPAPAASATKSSPVAEPTFAYRVDKECSITYRDNGNGAMSWVANVTVSGELITHASDKSGNIYRRDVQVQIGPNTFTAPVPLSEITDIGGVLYVGNGSYGCSVAPQR
jgi:hypothetical protein